MLGTVALGARPGSDIAIISGTSTVVLGLRGEAAVDPLGRALVTPLAGTAEGHGYGLEMDLVTTGSAFQWLTALTGAPSTEALVAEAAETDPLDAPRRAALSRAGGARGRSGSPACTARSSGSRSARRAARSCAVC